MSKHILVVEDQADNRRIIRDMLAPTDHEITEAENAAKKRRRGQRAAMTACRNLSARANCCRKFGITCNKSPRAAE